MAKLALEKHSGDIMQAAEELLANNGVISGDLSSLSEYKTILFKIILNYLFFK